MGIDEGVVGRLGKLHLMLISAVPRPDTEPHQSGRPFLNDKMISEHLDRLQQHVITMRDHLPPVLRLVLPFIGFQKPKVLRLGVAPDVEALAVVIDVVLMSSPSR